MVLRRSSSSSSSSSSSCEGPNTVEVLRQQEMSSYYQCRDYLASSSADGATVAIRAEMLEWVCKVTAFLKLTSSGDDIAVLTATLLDRFLQTPQGAAILTSVPDFRLATMACLYLTSKVHAHDHHPESSDESPYIVSAEVMSALSHGQFSARQVEDMEWVILQAMEWHTNPPTALTFVREFLLLLPCSVSAIMKEQAFQFCHEQIQRSIVDYPVFALTEASTIAFFCVQNALRTLGMDDILLKHIAAIFSYATHTDYICGEKLQAALLSGDTNCPVTSTSSYHNNILKRSPKRRSPSRRRWSRRMDSMDESPTGVVFEPTASSV